jgi:hypothetical protein
MSGKRPAASDESSTDDIPTPIFPRQNEPGSIPCLSNGDPKEKLPASNLASGQDPAAKPDLNGNVNQRLPEWQGQPLTPRPMNRRRRNSDKPSENE